MTKLSISQAWDECRAILARDGKLIGAVALALFVLPGILLNVVLPRAKAGAMPQPGLWMAVVLVVLVISFVGQLSIVRLALGPHITVGEAIAHGARRVLSYLGAVLIWTVPFLLVGSVLYETAGADRAQPSVAASLLLLAVSVVGIYVGVRLILISAVASAEAGGPIAILRRTFALTHGNWWRLFGFMLIFGLGALALLWAVGSVVGLVARLTFGDLSPLSVGGLIVIIVSQLISAVVSVVLFVMIARLYGQSTGQAGVQASVPSTGI